MIKIDFALAVSFYLFLAIALVCGLWIFYNLGKEYPLSDKSDYVEQCPYCTYVFFNYRAKQISVCPRCKSYLEAGKDNIKKHVPST